MLAAPAVHAQSTKLAGNLDQDTAASEPVVLWETGRDFAQRFTTGVLADDREWLVDSLELRIAGPPATPTYRVAIAEASGDAPGAVLGYLDPPPGAFATGRHNVEFTAQGGGITLAASTDYFVVVEVIAVSGTLAFHHQAPRHANSGLGMVTTSSTAEDSGASEGWSIGDVYSFEGRSYTSESGLYWRAHWDRVLKIALHGESQAKPPVESAGDGTYTAGGEQWGAGGVPVDRSAACRELWRQAKAAYPYGTVIVHCD